MWVIFRDPHTVFNHLDKNVAQMVEDKDIGAYQLMLQLTQGGTIFDVYPNVYFLQKLFTSATGEEYYARRYRVWEPVTTRVVQASEASPEVLHALCSRPESKDLTRAVVDASIEISKYMIELREGDEMIGFLLLKDNEITLLGVDATKKGNQYSSLLIGAAKKMVKDKTIRIHAMSNEVATKVYAPHGFVRTGGMWLEAPTTQYTGPSFPTEPSLLRKL
jgi:hypothetical protein